MSRKRDLATLKLSAGCRKDIAELSAIADEIDEHNEAIKSLQKRRRLLWARRVNAGDLFETELAEISRVKQSQVNREKGRIG